MPTSLYFAVSTGKNLPISNNASKSSGSIANTETNSSAKEINFATSDGTNPSANVTSLTVNNVGLEKSKPIITLWGSGVVEILINELSIFQIDFGLDEYLTVDSEIEECYKDETLTLKNRQMTGEFPTLEVGASVITWVGTLTKIVVEVRSRWL